MRDWSGGDFIVTALPALVVNASHSPTQESNFVISTEDVPPDDVDRGAADTSKLFGTDAPAEDHVEMEPVGLEASEELELTSFNYENMDGDQKSDLASFQSIKSHYEEINFKTDHSGSSEAVFYPSDESGQYEEVVVNDTYSIRHHDLPTVHKFSHNDPNYENFKPGHSQSISSRASSASQGTPYESMFGMARRFPSIRMTPSAKRDKRRKQSLAKSTSSTNSFPRESGNSISIGFGTLDGMYSKPQRQSSNTVVPVNGHFPDSALQAGPESGSCARPVNAVYGLMKAPSMASIRSYLSGKLSFGVRTPKKSQNGRNGSIQSVPTTQSQNSVETRKIGDDDEIVVVGVDPNPEHWCSPCSMCSNRNPDHYQPRSSQSTSRSRRRSCLSTSFLCAVIALSVIAFIIAGGVLLYQYMAGEVIALGTGGVPRPSQSNQSQEPYFETNQSERSNLRLPPPLFTSNPGGNVRQLQPIAEHWDQWSPWSPCSDKCQSGESQARSRACLDPNGNTKEDIKPCIKQGGLNVDIRRCLCNSSDAWRQPQTAALTSSQDEDSVRFCDHCEGGEVCVAQPEDYFPSCRSVQDPRDPTGCGGLCRIEEQICHRLDTDAFRCLNVRQPRQLGHLGPSWHCPSNYMECHDGVCIPNSKVCDGFSHCSADEDEVNCPLEDALPAGPFQTQALREERGGRRLKIEVECPRAFVRCDDGQTCLNPALFCDGQSDCPDSSDEPDGCHK